jgi:hypothetical protein
MLTSDDYRQLAERCAGLARECATPSVAEALRTLALDYLTRAVCPTRQLAVPERRFDKAHAAGSQWWRTLPQVGEASSPNRSVSRWSGPCDAMRASRSKAAFQSHLLQATRMVACGSSRSR